MAYDSACRAIEAGIIKLRPELEKHAHCRMADAIIHERSKYVDDIRIPMWIHDLLVLRSAAFEREWTEQETADWLHSLSEYCATPDIGDRAAVSCAMSDHGGSFAATLGETLRQADPDNARAIYRTWPDLIERYRAFVKAEESL